ncbi:hypothetical protein M2277_001875 [Paenibacillus sp. LBL]|uniref:hypothetical protein n=1 Tax=Paenibacillus sp. LBL TaxID=2940563 RepID=UPI002476B902|nr:hypothetical protein [Paenibacillus sp. LBL]MDH6671225.1 hypothetical protein [Paenibacillus sp. LBL]
MSVSGNNGKWGDHYPVSCPPSSAKARDINPVYRLALHNPPLDEDFYSHKEANLPYPPIKECEACAISVFTDIKQIQKAKKNIVVFKRRGHIVEGQIARETGVASEPDHKSHINWWVYTGVDAKKYFGDNS